MYIKIRTVGCASKEDIIINISKMAMIQELRKMIHKETHIDIDEQLLLYKGKQLIDDHRIMDYEIQLNDVIQLMIRKQPILSEDSVNREKSDSESKEKVLINAESIHYKIGDFVDVIHDNNGAWYEATIVEILREQNVNKEEELIFKVKGDQDVTPFEINVSFNEIRPRSFYTYKLTEIEPGMIVLANYNIEEPTDRGPWFDFKVNSVDKKVLSGTVLVGKDKTPIEKCNIKYVDEVMRIETPQLLSDRTKPPKKPQPRKYPYNCLKCKDGKNRKCKECGCKICGGKESCDKIILCDECDYGYHIGCLTPPLEKVPEDDDWYCPECKTDDSKIVKAGEKLKLSNKKANMASRKNNSERDWGKGMACVGRTTECTIVPKDHYGPVPGIDVGTCWKFRLQVSEAGIHRPHVAGIHGRESDGAYSLVLSGGYEDDIDNGEEFFYTGSGGRDLSGNKRVNDQSCDQKLTRMNKALALNCYAKFNNVEGAESEDWKKGKPVRVVRNYKLGKHSNYAPKDGNRYDGIYKVVKYYPEKGKSGFIVWRYLLRRDDPEPAPWEENGQEFDMIYPSGYLEAEQKKEKENTNQAKSPTKSVKRGTKRKTNENNQTLTKFFSPSPKKPKISQFKIDPEVYKLITCDTVNKKFWDECREFEKDGKQKFLEKVEELFLCICCQEVVYLPVTLECKHTFCKACLKRSFSAKIYSCPCCRFDLTENFIIKVNEDLSNALKLLFPGYEATR